MKRLLSLLCTLAIVIACVGTVFASTETASRDYTIADMNNNLYEGEWTEIASGLQLFIPTAFSQVSTTSADGDTCTVFMTADGSHAIEVHEMTSAAFGYSSLAEARLAYLGGKSSSSGKNSVQNNKYYVLEDIQRSSIDVSNDLVDLNINDNTAFSVLLDTGDYLVVTQRADKFITIKFIDFVNSNDEYRAWVQNMVVSLSTVGTQITVSNEGTGSGTNSASATVSTGEMYKAPVLAISLLCVGALLFIFSRIVVSKKLLRNNKK